MGRREEPVDPGSPLFEFASGLRALREAAGSPPYRDLARKAKYSPSVLSAAASGRSLPTWDATRAYVSACGGDADEWRELWERMADVLRATDPGLMPPEVPEGEDVGSHVAGESGDAEESPSDAGGSAEPRIALTEPLGRTDPRRIGRFRVLGRLGGGSMGEVYLATSPAGRPVAVKVVRAEYARDPVFRQRFAKELAAIRRVGGGHTPALIASDAEAERPWLATEFVPGPSLERVVAAAGPLPEPVVLGLAAGIAEALEAIHEAGLVHRDLKPGNILLGDDGPKVIDFGISRALEGTALTMAGQRIGTAGFTAPEQAERGETVPAGDVFALGCVLAYAATGVLPFGEGADHEVLYRIVHEEPAPEALACRDKQLRDLIRSCLSKDSDARPAPREIIEACGHRDGVGLPAAIAAQAAARGRDAAKAVSRARATHRVRVGLAPLLLILAIAVVTVIASRGSGTPRVVLNPPNTTTPTAASLPDSPLTSQNPTGIGTVGTTPATTPAALPVGAATSTAPAPGTPSAPAGSPAAGTPSYQPTFGPGCGLSTTDGGGHFNWTPVPGLPADQVGCTAPLYTKVSGIAPGNSGAWQSWAEWFFYPQAGQTCTLQVYLPVTSRADTKNTLYNVFSDNQQKNLVGWYYLDQSGSQGGWTTIGNADTGASTYTASTGTLDLTVTDASTGDTFIVADLARAVCV